MKRILSFCVICVFVLALLCGCQANRKSDDKLNIVCTIFPQYDFVREIVGEHANVSMLVPGGVESHDFQLENMTVADMKKVSNADMVIHVGGQSDSDWINELKNTISNKDIEWVALQNLVESIDGYYLEDQHSEHDGHDHENALDEHVWTSPKRAVEIVDKLTEQICNLDKQNQDVYKNNCERYISELNDLDRSLQNIVLTANNKTLLFADRFPFRYLCVDYGFSFDASFLGCSTVTDPSVHQIANLTEKAEQIGAKVIFYMENSNPIYAEQIANKVGAKVLMLHSCHTLTKAEIEQGKSYISIMEENIKNISEAVK